MLAENQKHVSVPLQVLMNYEQFITAKELKLLLLFLGTCGASKRDWANVATMMGHSDTGSVASMLNSMAARGLINLVSHEIDITPLWQACMSDTETEVTVVEKKATTTTPKDNTHYVVASEILTEYNIVVDKHFAARTVKSLLDKGAAVADIKAVCAMMHATNVKRANGGVPQTINLYNLLAAYDWWLKNGKPTTAVAGKPKKDFSNLT